MNPIPVSQLFTLRLWPEANEDGRVIWRGKLHCVSTNDTRYFRDWPALLPLLISMLNEIDNGRTQSTPFD